MASTTLASPASMEELLKRIEEERRLSAVWKYGPAVANLYDAAATQYAMGRGGQEVNPIMRGIADEPALFYPAKVGSGLLMGFLADKIARSGHPNIAKIVAGLNIAVPLGAGTHNIVQARKR